MNIVNALLAAVLLLPSGAFAQEQPDLCQTAPELEDYVGVWQVRVLKAKIMPNAAPPIVEPGGAVRQATLALIGGTLVMTDFNSDVPPVDLVQTGEAELDWYWGGEEGLLSSEDLELTMGCPLADLPRFTGTASNLIEGQTATHLFRLIAIEPYFLTGQYQLQFPGLGKVNFMLTFQRS